MSEIKFHKELYSKAAIEEAVQAYTGLCVMKLVTGKTHYILSMSGQEDDTGLFEDEVANYVLAESVKRL